MVWGGGGGAWAHNSQWHRGEGEVLNGIYCIMGGGEGVLRLTMSLILYCTVYTSAWEQMPQ